MDSRKILIVATLVVAAYTGWTSWSRTTCTERLVAQGGHYRNVNNAANKCALVHPYFW